MFKTLILIDNDFIDYSLGLIDVANKLAADLPSEVYGLTINGKLNKNITGVDYLIRVEIPPYETRDSRIITDVIELIQDEYIFDSILILATDFGRMIAPRLAMRLEVGLVADITDVDVDDQGRKLIRPAYSGNMLASIVCESSPIMASIHPNVFHFNKDEKTPKLIDFKIKNLKSSTIKVISESEDNKDKDIRDVDVLIAAGGGFKNELSQLHPLSEKLNGAIAVSKQLVDENRAEMKIQVGQSGKTVSPSLYVALGIYGAIHHVEGLNNVKNIISVNTDINAPMNHLADIVVVGDAVEFLNKMNKKMK